MSRLISLRREEDADCVRLRSSNYTSTSCHMMILNDPRKNARSIMDVAIASEPEVWGTEKQLVSALGYVHYFVVAKGTVVESVDIAPLYVTIFFTFETARQQRIRRGLQLRIYNAVLIPNTTNMQRTTDKQAGGQQIPLLPVASVVCTRLCEPYPLSLPPLPPPPGLTENAEDTAVVEGMTCSWERNEGVPCEERVI